MTAGGARTARRPRTGGINGWAGTARPATGWSPSPRSAPMSGCITRSTRCRTPRPGTLRKAGTTPAFRTKLAIGADLAIRARDAGFVFRAVCADSAYGDQDGLRGELAEAGLPFVMALKPRRGTWAYDADAHIPVDAARALALGGPADPGGWQAVTRAFRDGHTETWYAADAVLDWWGRTAPGAWWWPPPTRLPCSRRPPGTWSPACPARAAHARPKPVGLENRIRQVTDLEPRHHLHDKQNRMRRRGCGAATDLCPVTAQVCVMSMPGISEVPHRSMAVRSVAGLVWQVPRRACRLWSVPVAGRAPGRRRIGPGPRLWQAGVSVACPAGASDGRVTMGALDVAGLSWTSWDMIQNVRRADQAH